MLQQQHLKYYQLTEKDIMGYIREYLRYGGWFVVRLFQGLGAYKGISDLVAIKNGITVWIECKSLRGTLTKDQHTFAENIKKHGGVYIVARSIDDLVQQLQSKGIKP